MADLEDVAAASKKLHLIKRIGTHNGTFHCDEVLACYLLMRLPEFRHAEIIRTRDPKQLETCDVVVDVGGLYDPSKHRYDHHQRSFKETLKTLQSTKPFTTKLSSAGLVYFHFGRTVIAQTLGIKEEDVLTEKMFDKIYENFIQEIDAIDNGINQTEDEPRYQITTNLSSRVAGLNPSWNDPKPDPQGQFEEAIKLVGKEFMNRLEYYRDSWLPARSLVERALLDRYQADESGEIVELKEGGCPWKEHLFDLETELSIQPSIKFVIYTDQNGKYRVQCVSIRPKSFENRLSLLEEWRGVRDAALSELSGIPGCIFVHAGGFIGGNETRDGALEMARRTLKSRKNIASVIETNQ